MIYNKVCIVGAGAIGVWLGAGLARASCDVSFLARGETLKNLQIKGLKLHSPQSASQPEQTHPVRASNNAAELGVQDLVVIAVKAPALREVSQQIAPLLGKNTVVLTAMNGVPWWFLQGFGGSLANHSLKSVDATGDVTAAIPASHIIGGVVHASCSVVSPGVIRHAFGNKVIVGEPSGQITPRVTALAALLEKAGFEAPIAEQIQRDIWFKLWGNMTMNPVSAITGASSGQVLDDDLVRGFCSNVMLEAKEIGARLGIAIDQQPEDRHAVTRKLGSFKTSMLQDVEAGKAVELDALVGAVQELGRLTQVATPYTNALFGLARLHARVHGLY
jgi:2-dehydropantoate 2-reductase